MAARIRKIRHDEETRAKIKTSQLINRLQAHIFGEIDLKPTQVQSALGLLRKTIPDLSQADNTTEVTHRYVARLPEVAKSTAEWQQQHVPTTEPTLQ